MRLILILPEYCLIYVARPTSYLYSKIYLTEKILIILSRDFNKFLLKKEKKIL